MVSCGFFKMPMIILYRDVSKFSWLFIVLIKWQEQEQTLKHVMCYIKIDVKKAQYIILNS